MKNLIALLAVALSLIACTTPATKQPEAAKTDTAAEAKTETAQTAAPDTAAQKLAEETSAAAQLDKESVYFDFDKSAIKPEFRDLLKKQAEFLSANKNASVTLEGNCDERGSTEYNLGLGNRRATAVSGQLQALGVTKDRIGTVSNGEEKPRLTCHEEKCWKENRRVDFLHKLN